MATIGLCYLLGSTLRIYPPPRSLLRVRRIPPLSPKGARPYSKEYDAIEQENKIGQELRISLHRSEERNLKMQLEYGNFVADNANIDQALARYASPAKDHDITKTKFVVGGTKRAREDEKEISDSLTRQSYEIMSSGDLEAPVNKREDISNNQLSQNGATQHPPTAPKKTVSSL